MEVSGNSISKLKLSEFIDYLSQKTKLSLPEIAKRLQISKQTIYNWRSKNNHKIPVASLLKLKYPLQTEFNIKIRHANNEFIEVEECQDKENKEEKLNNLKNIIVDLTERIAELEMEVRKLKNEQSQ